MSLIYFIFALTAFASGHGEAPAADPHGGGHGGGGEHGAPTADAHGGGGGHGGGHGDEKKAKKEYLPYALAGAENCKVPPSHKDVTPDCGTPEYGQYLKDVEAYNECVKPFETRILLPLRACTKPRVKPGPDVKKLLDVP